MRTVNNLFTPATATWWRLCDRVAAVCLLAGLLVFIRPDSSTLLFDADSHSYLHISDRLLEEPRWWFTADPNLEEGLLTRSPGYPHLLAAARAVCGDLSSAVYALHGVLTVGSAALLAYALAGIVPLSLLMSALGIAATGQPFYSWILTEYVSLHLTLMFLALWTLAFRRGSLRWVFFCALAAGAGVVVRSTSSCLFPSLFLLLVVRRADGARAIHASLRRSLVVVFCGLAPVWGLVLCNGLRFGAPGLIGGQGLQLLQVTTLLPVPPVSDDDVPALRSLAAVLRAERQTLEPGDLGGAAQLGYEPLYNKMLFNRFRLVPRWQEREGIPNTAANELASVYSKRAIEHAPNSFLSWFFWNYRANQRLLVWLVPICFVPAYFLLRRQQLEVAYLALNVLAIHLGNTALMSAFFMAYWRYFYLTYPLLWGVSLCVCWCFLARHPLLLRLQGRIAG